MNDLNDYKRGARGTPLAWGLLGAVALGLAGCSASTAERRAGDPAKSDLPASPEMTPSVSVGVAGEGGGVPASGASVRVGGNLKAIVTGRDGDYRSGPCRIDTPLPEGYPGPTPPGAIELKTYPKVRLAEVRGKENPDRGMNRAFWPLFNHIKRHEIAMTSPVQMEYSGLRSDSATQAGSWSMAFLYRTPDLNAPGVEGPVRVYDAEPVTVLAIGLKGDYSLSLVEKGRRALGEFLAANPQWEAVGDWRALYYNGPSLMFWDKWAEVQVPVRAAGSPDAPKP